MAGGEGQVCGGSYWGLERWSTSVRVRRLTTELVDAWYIWGLSQTGTCLSRTEIPRIRGIHKVHVNDSCRPGYLGMCRLGGPNRLGDLVVLELVGEPPGGRCGIWKERGGGLSGRTSFPCVGRGPFTGNSECQLKRGSETGHPSVWELF